jgi:NAD(P)-dependent dehydrogenase (short-subunit alcohol dehydrogenase family)
LRAGFARKLAAHGARVVIHGREEERAIAEKVRQSIQEAGGKAIVVLGDLRDEAICRNIVRQAVAQLGRRPRAG